MGDTTNNIGELKVDNIVYVDAPHGHFIIDDKNAASIFMIAGGIGVDPLIGIISEIIHNKNNRPVKLLYGIRLQSQIAFQDELAEVSKSINLDIDYVLSKPPKDWQGKQGIIDRNLL